MARGAPGSIDGNGFPPRVIERRLCPTRVITQMKLPGAINGHNAVADGWDDKNRSMSGPGRLRRLLAGLLRGLLAKGDSGKKQEQSLDDQAGVHVARITLGRTIHEQDSTQQPERDPFRGILLFVRLPRQYGGKTRSRLQCIRLTSACDCKVGDSRCPGKNACRNMEGRMLQNNQDYAADLHTYAAHAHTAAAAAHHRGDHETAVELSVKAQEYSMKAAEKTEEIARRTSEPLRV